jgi:hypothetical protein
MGKKRGLAAFSTLWFGLALAGGCESISGGTTKRTTYNPPPTFTRNTGATESPGTQTMTPGTGTNVGATGGVTGGTVQPITSGAQPVGGMVDPNTRGALPITDPSVLQTGAQLKDTSRLGASDTTILKPLSPGSTLDSARRSDVSAPTDKLLPAAGTKSWQTDLPPVSPVSRDDGTDRIRITNTPGGTVLPPPQVPSSMDGPGLKPLAPAAPVQPPSSLPPSVLDAGPTK